MIVPDVRLLWLVGAGVLPCALIAAIFPSHWPLAGAAVLTMLALALLDLVLSRKRLDAVQVSTPALLRYARGREGKFDITVVRNGKVPATVRIGLVLPEHLGAQDDLTVALPGGERFQFSSTVRPTRRGSFRLEEVRLEIQSAARLWSMRARLRVDTEIRVYPNLFADKKTAATLLMNRGAIGIHAQRQVGKGRDFEKLREYVPGDTYDDIHWRATARHGRPVTKVYQVERTQEVYAVIDCSRLTGRKANGEEVLEGYLSAGLLLGLAVQNDGDLFGVIAFSDRVERFVRAGHGRSHFGVCRDALYTVRSKRAAPDFEELSQFLRARLRKRALLVIMTALDDPMISEDFERNIRALRGQHLIVVGMAKPAGVMPLFVDDDVASTHDIVEKLSGHVRWHKLNETQTRLKARGLQLSLIEDNKLGSQIVVQYRQVKTRQLL
jgi:uncharacterized protein (DUF58 family)